MTWLPTGYEVPKPQSNYFKFEKGPNKFRIMSEPILGYLYWNSADKPVRMKTYTTIPSDIRLDGEGNPEKIKHFWAFVVWNFKAEKLQILEITQASIMGPMSDLVDNEDWGDPRKYDITVTKKGEKLDTEYSVTPSPAKPAPQPALHALRTTPISLTALFNGEDPFSPSTVTHEEAPQPKRNTDPDPEAIDRALEEGYNGGPAYHPDQA